MPVANWKQKMIEARKLRGKGAELNYNRIKLLVDVYNDKQFRIDEGGGQPLDDGEAAELLDTEVGDLCAEFLVLKATINAFPDKKQWVSNRLDLMVAKARALEEEVRARANPKSKPSKPVDRREYKRVVERIGEMANEIRNLRQENIAIKTGTRVEELEIERTTIKRANGDLSTQLKAAKAEIADLTARYDEAKNIIKKKDSEISKLRKQIRDLQTKRSRKTVAA